MFYIPDDQIVKIQNRMSDIRNTPAQDSLAFFAATYELLGTLDAILFDARNMERKKPTTMVLPEGQKDDTKGRDKRKPSPKGKDKSQKLSYFIDPDDNATEEKKMNSHERRKERRRLEREAAKTEKEIKEVKAEEKTDEKKEVTSKEGNEIQF